MADLVETQQQQQADVAESAQFIIRYLSYISVQVFAAPTELSATLCSGCHTLFGHDGQSKENKDIAFEDTTESLPIFFCVTQVDLAYISQNVQYILTLILYEHVRLSAV